MCNVAPQGQASRNVEAILVTSVRHQTSPSSNFRPSNFRPHHQNSTALSKSTNGGARKFPEIYGRSARALKMPIKEEEVGKLLGERDNENSQKNQLAARKSVSNGPTNLCGVH